MNAPPVLRVRGVLPREEGVTIVGTRACTPNGDRFAFELAAELARAGLAVWSGGALGIDGAAHRGALEAGGATVVVIGSGLSNPTPEEHLGLFEEVVRRGGAIMSRQEDDDPAATRQYHARNAVLAAATRLTVVVECPLRSGALSTVARARALGRLVAFVPHAPWMNRGTGGVLEIQRGAPLVTCARDVLELMGRPRANVPPATAPVSGTASRRSVEKRAQNRQPGLFPALDEREPSPPTGLTADQARLYAVVERPMHLDEICEELALPVTVVVPLVIGLVLSGCLAEEGPSVFRRA